MEKPTNREMLLDTTMRIVAEGGMLSFSMRQVTKAIGVSESLIYRHYGTKENLLFQCFQSVDRQIADLFTDERLPVIASEKELYEYIRGLWMRYFSFLIQNSYKTLYYFEYRDLPYIATILTDTEKYGTLSAQTYFNNFVDISEAIDKAYHVFDKVSAGHLWTYILDVTGIFAKRVIRGKLPGNAESCESMWRLFYAGLSGLF